jgi:hypothetical protein
MNKRIFYVLAFLIVAAMATAAAWVIAGVLALVSVL